MKCTLVSNKLLDSLPAFTPAQVKILLAIARHGVLSSKSIDDITGLSKTSRINSLSELVKSGLVAATEPLSPEQIKIAVVEGKTPQSISSNWGPEKNCEWCGGSSLLLHEHHYPVPKSLGGKDVVSICPNCHAEFHLLEASSFYKLTEAVR